MLVVFDVLLVAVVVMDVVVMAVVIVWPPCMPSENSSPRASTWSIIRATAPMFSPAADRMSSTHSSLSPPLQRNTSASEMRITSRGVGSKLWASRPAVTSRYGSTRSPPMARTKS